MLVDLDLRGNLLTGMDLTEKHGKRQLKNLVLKDNKLTTIKLDVLLGFNKLDLSGNQLQDTEFLSVL